MNILTYESEPGLINKSYADSLKSILRSSLPHISIDIQAADKKLSSIISNWNEREDLSNLLNEYFGDATEIRVLICTTNNSKYYNWSIKNAPHAMWGCCHSEFLAIEYAQEPNKLTTQLHESLHLFGVDDCYEESNLSPKYSCSKESCIMRYGSKSQTICRSVTAQLINKYGNNISRENK